MVRNFVLAAREHFHANEKLRLRWRGPRRVVKKIRNCVYDVEDLCNIPGPAFLHCEKHAVEKICLYMFSGIIISTSIAFLRCEIKFLLNFYFLIFSHL